MVMVTMVVGVGEVIAPVCISEAVTSWAARPKINMRWLQMSCILYCCLDVVVDGYPGC